jgi:hypothetical protein
VEPWTPQNGNNTVGPQKGDSPPPNRKSHSSHPAIPLEKISYSLRGRRVFYLPSWVKIHKLNIISSKYVLNIEHTTKILIGKSLSFDEISGLSKRFVYGIKTACG